MGLRFCFIS